MPPRVQRAWVDGSTGKNSPCGRSAAFSCASTSPGSTSAVRAAGSTCSTRLRYLAQSITSARFTVWPHWLVPPPRGSTGTPCSRAIASVAAHVVDGSRHDDADRLDLVDRGIGGVAAAIGAAEQHLPGDRVGQLRGKAGSPGAGPGVAVGSVMSIKTRW